MKSVTFLAIAVCTLTSQALAYNQNDVNNAIDAAERICLSGNRYKFEADANGDITILKRSPGVEAKVSVDKTQARGSQFFENDTVRQLVDDKIRECMKLQWPQVLKAFDAPPSPPQPAQPSGPRSNYIVCHGEYKSECEKHPFTVFEHCGNDNGVGGADPNLSGRNLCGNSNFKARSTETSYGGNHCGYSWYAIDCY